MCGDTTLHCGLTLFTVGQSRVKPPPGVECFPRPNPKSGRDAHNECHEILYHEDSEVRAHVGVVLDRTWHSVRLTRLADPRPLPLLSEGLLVEIAGDDDGGGHGVKHAEDPYPHHQLLQLLRLGAVVLHDGPDAEQGHKARQEEGGSDE